jgi:hypothetical protein
LVFVVLSFCVYIYSNTFEPASPINICTDPASITTTIKNNSGATAPAGVVTQTLPAGCSLLIISPMCPGLTVSQNNNVITYTFAGLNDQDSCSVTANLIIPCSVTTLANAALNIVYGSPDYTFASDPTTTFQVSRPIMHILNFIDDTVALGAISPNTPQKLLVSENRHRRFDFLVSDGVVGGLTFTYRYESEIAPKGFVLEGVLPNGTANGLPTALTRGLPAPANNPATYVITGSDIASLFPDQATTMGFGRSIRVREFFDVIHCSPAPNNDGTDFSITWDCPSSTGQPCTTDTTRRTILVESSGGGLTPGYSTPGLDLCGITPSDMVVSFRNSAHDPGTGKIPGSAMKTLRLLDAPMNLDPFTVQTVPLGSTPSGAIFLEGSGTSLSVDVTVLNALYPGFYVYDQALHRVRLNLDVLTGQPLGPTGPLVSGFIPEQPTAVFNEIVDSGILYLRFRQVIFNCHAAVFNASSPSFPTFDFDDWPKPYFGYLFFGRDGNDRWRFYYDNMCQASPLPHSLPAAEAWEFGVLRNNFPVTGFAEADKTDVQLGDHAVLDFYYQYQGGGIPSAFSFAGSLSGNPYFTCVNTYQAVVTIPDLYDLNSATYYADPSGASGLSISPLPNPAFKPGYKVYTFTGLQFNGRISVDVTLTSCPFGTGGFDLFNASVQAVCNGCTDCAYTITSFNTQLYHHCQGPCDGPPQGTANFSFNRSSLGWTDESMTTPVAAGPGISLNRAYNCDTIAVTSDGSFDPNSPAAALTTALAFRIDYTPGVNFQFFEFVSGVLTYGSFPPYAIDMAQDLSGSFKGTPVPVTGWPGNVNGADSSCSLWITFPAAVLVNLKSSGAAVPLSLQMVVRVKPMATTPTPGFYNLPQVRAQYYTDVGDSCDSWGDNMMVLNVRTTSSFVIRAANDADQSLGWPFNTGVCERHFLFRISVSGGLPAMNDFRNEFRPIVQMPAPADLLLTLPSGVRFNGATFSIFNRPGWAFSYPIQALESGSTVNLQSWVTNGVARPWPLLDKDGPPIDIMIRGSLINECPATVADPIGPATLAFPFTSGVYSTEPACRNTRAVPDVLNYPNAPPTSIAVSSLVSPYHVTSTPTTITGIDFTYLGWGRSQIENTWVRVTSGGLTVTTLRRTGVAAAIAADANGYFRLGNITAGAANAARLALNVTLTGCNPGVKIPVTIEYGYGCAGYPTAYPPLPESCVQQSYTFDVLPEASGMSMTVTPPTVTTGGPCQTYQYKVRLTSTQLADLENPHLTIQLPPGLSFATFPLPTYFRSDNAGTAAGNLTTFTQAGQDFVWNINHDVYADGGMPPTPAFVDLTFTVTGTCASSGGDSRIITFHPSGKNICGGDVSYPDHQETLRLSQHPVVTSCPGDAVLECPATPTFGTPTFFEACDPNLIISFADASLPVAFPAASAVQRTWTATDHCGNSVSCSQTITLLDTTSPTVTSCPSDVALEAPATPVFGTPVFADTCDVNLTVTFADLSLPATCPARSVTRRTWTATDACGNSATCNQTITVQDTTNPMVTSCPADASFECPAAPVFGTPVFTDASGALLTVSSADTVLSTVCPVVSAVTRTWTAMDGCGNSVTCSQTVTTHDSTPPIIALCPSDRTVTADLQCFATIPDLTGQIVAADFCSAVTIVQNPSPNDSYGPGAHTIVFTVCDECGNCVTCPTLFTVRGPITMDCPADVIVQSQTTQGVAVSYAVPVAASVCCPGVTVNCQPEPGRFSVGVTPVNCTATDDCGNTDVCNFVVEVLPPVGVDACSFTQGFYGNAKGKFNNTPSLALIGNLLAAGPLRVGKVSGSRSLAILPGDASLLQQRMPAGGPPAMLPDSGRHASRQRASILANRRVAAGRQGQIRQRPPWADHHPFSEREVESMVAGLQTGSKLLYQRSPTRSRWTAGHFGRSRGGESASFQRSNVRAGRINRCRAWDQRPRRTRIAGTGQPRPGRCPHRKRHVVRDQCRR